jgi:Outer membrane protein beta-barrel domain
MNRLIFLAAGLCLALCGTAQTDTTRHITDTAGHPNDTLHVGNLLIIRNGKPDWDNPQYFRIHRHRNWSDRPSKVSTDWVILDLGIAYYNDQTNYSSTAAQKFAPGATRNWFNLNDGKSVDVNIWLFMQRFSLIKNIVNLKWGLGLELNNYRYEENIRYLINPTSVIIDTINYTKDKLAVDYFTVPLMLNFNFTPHRRRNPYGFSIGASAGYRYSSRQKFKSHEFGKQKTFNDFDLQPWKISYVAELELGWVKFYGSYAVKSMFSDGLNQIPYTVGIRLGAW